MTGNDVPIEQERRRLIAAGDPLWEQLTAILDARPIAVLHRPPSPAWTSRDIYAHLARWTEQSIAFIERKRTGDSPRPFTGDADAVNAAWAADDAALTLDQARAHCIETRGRLIALLLNLSNDEWQQFGRNALADVNGLHYQEHLDAIL